jgi:adenosylhomocysteine nucleosidase
MIIGVVAALEAEAAALYPAVGEPVAGSLFPLRQVAIGQHRLFIATCGVGKVNAAMVASQLVAIFQCKLLLVVGTAGQLRRDGPQCMWLKEAVQHDYGAARADGFTCYPAGEWPIGPVRSSIAMAALPDPGSGVPGGRIVSGDSFVECASSAERLSGVLSGHMVDMETAAVAQVAQHMGVPWGGVKAVTDDADGQSVGDFEINLERAAAQAAKALERAIAALP